MSWKKRVAREAAFCFLVFCTGVVLLPLLLAAIGVLSGQAPFFEVLRAFYDYLFHFTVLAASVLYGFFQLLRLFARIVRTAIGKWR